MLRRPPESTLTDTLCAYPTFLLSQPRPTGRAGRQACRRLYFARGDRPAGDGLRLAEKRSRACVHDRDFARAILPFSRRSSFSPSTSAWHQRPSAVGNHLDRKSVVSGKRVSVRVDLGGRRIIKKKKKHTN